MAARQKPRVDFLLPPTSFWKGATTVRATHAPRRDVDCSQGFALLSPCLSPELWGAPGYCEGCGASGEGDNESRGDGAEPGCGRTCPCRDRHSLCTSGQAFGRTVASAAEVSRRWPARQGFPVSQAAHMGWATSSITDMSDLFAHKSSYQR
eukprot:scaffold7333_cov196-Pinguiococcus_pyrenoidosus.AAC.1